MILSGTYPIRYRDAFLDSRAPPRPLALPPTHTKRNSRDEQKHPQDVDLQWVRDHLVGENFQVGIRLSHLIWLSTWGFAALDMFSKDD